VRAFAFALLVVAGCSSNSKPKEIPAYELEVNLRKQIAEKGKYTPPVYCPSGLSAYVGAETTCSIPIAGRNYDVKATVTAVHGSDLDYDIEVASLPRPLPGETE
jgi:hypothetical protein